jgi:hypothetical protein
MMATDNNEELPVIQRPLAICGGPSQTQEQFNVRISGISISVEPLDTNIPDCMA